MIPEEVPPVWGGRYNSIAPHFLTNNARKEYKKMKKEHKVTMDDCRLMAACTGNADSPLMQDLEDMENPDRANRLTEDQKQAAAILTDAFNKRAK